MHEIKTALVAGGTGGIGEGIVKILLEHGMEVFVPVREHDKSDRLSSYIAGVSTGKLHLVDCDLADSQSVVDCREAIAKITPSLDLIIASVGSYYFGYSLHRIPRADWDRLISENVDTHYNLQHEFLTQLHAQNQGVYITLTGPEANFVHPETGLMSVVSSAQKMMTQVAALEAANTGVKVYSVTSTNPIASRTRGGQVDHHWVTAEEMGNYLLALAHGKVPHTKSAHHEVESKNQIKKYQK